MSNREKQDLIDEITAFCKQQPFFFYDLLKAFDAISYRDILIAWGEVRARVVFDRDEEGHYVYPTTQP